MITVSYYPWQIAHFHARGLYFCADVSVLYREPMWLKCCCTWQHCGCSSRSMVAIDGGGSPGTAGFARPRCFALRCAPAPPGAGRAVLMDATDVLYPLAAALVTWLVVVLARIFF